MPRIAIEMPNLGFDTTTGKLSSWLKRVGDTIVRGESIAEIETEKTTVELEALDAGTLVEIVREAGEDVPVGDTVAWIEDGIE
jgi:pyruvate dehydrogenase E2 component (dihydrolipoamide acetyltransferase)